MIKSSRLLGAVCASVFIAATFAIAASAAEAASLRYEVVDRFDFFRTNPDGSLVLDPDGNPVRGEPLDKGFAVTGTMDANGLGLYDQGEAPFQRWNITETVLNSDGSTTDYIFNEGNSSWRLDQAPNQPLNVVGIDPFEILLLQAFIGGSSPIEAENTLFLESTALDQRIFWFVPATGPDSNFFASQVISTGTFNGVYETDTNGNLLIGRRVPEVPVPAAVWLFGSGLLGLVGMARRKKAA